MRDVDRYPHVLDTAARTWHRRPAGDASDGPTYPTVCATTVTTYVVDDPAGPAVDEWETRCKGCYP